MAHIYLIINTFINSLRIVFLHLGIIIGSLLVIAFPCQAQEVSIYSSNDLSCLIPSSTLRALASCSDAVTFSFEGPNGFAETNTTGVVSVTVNGLFSVTATNASGTCEASNTVLVGSSLHPDYLPLVDLYNSTGGPNWYTKTGWLTNCDPCSGWFGITCSEGRVTSLSLTSNASFTGNNLRGTLPSSIGSLAELRKLNLGYNLGGLSGGVPSSFTALSKLQELNLVYDGLKGTVLDKLTGLTQLEYINLSYNQFSGTIPENISALTKLKEFSIYTNHIFDPTTGFTGTIPASLSTLTGLEILTLGFNQLTGTVPPGIGQLTKLKQLYLSNNQLTGQVPSELGNLINVRTFYLGQNQFTGTIPASLGNLSNVELFGLEGNRLTGEIPATLAGLSKVFGLYLYNNQLSGQIPDFFGTLPNLAYVVLDNNQLTGSLPTSLTSLVGLQQLQLNNNQLTGSLPAGFGNRIYLNYLNLSNNQLSGCIPQSYTALCGKNVYLDNNNNLASWSEFCQNGINSLVTLKDGSWYDPSVWSCGRRPTLKDNVILQHSVMLHPSQSGQSRKIIYKSGGRLNYGGVGSLRIGQ